MPPYIRPKHLKQLSDQGWLVVEDFLPLDLCNGLVKDIRRLRGSTNDHEGQSIDYFKVAGVGQQSIEDGNHVDNGHIFGVRRSETCSIDEESSKKLPQCDDRERLREILNDLRDDLDVSSTALDKDVTELMYAYYPNGGYYRRHKDAEKSSTSLSSIREYSFLLYLNVNWSTTQGGYLRIHRDGGGDELPPGVLPNYIDIEPRAGTLVVMESKRVPHEVLDTRFERLAVVGWYLASLTSSSSSTNVKSSSSPTYLTARESFIESDTLKALLRLRDSVPGMLAKLKPNASPPDYSGMIWDDFTFPNSNKQVCDIESKANIDEAPDTSNIDYWKKICSFDEKGRITTLSLGGQRLKNIESNILVRPEFSRSTIIDLAGTDIPVELLVQFLSSCDRLKQLHLGGNALGDTSVRSLMNGVPNLLKLRSLDMRYNDITSVGAIEIGKFLSSPECSLEYLYLEGNDLGCDGARALSNTGPLLDLFLGQNNIKGEGASALAEGLKNGCLKKLYLEGNAIGPDGAISFRKALEDQGDSRNLEKLYADNNGIGKTEFGKLGAVLNSVTMIGEGGLFQD